MKPHVLQAKEKYEGGRIGCLICLGLSLLPGEFIAIYHLFGATAFIESLVTLCYVFFGSMVTLFIYGVRATLNDRVEYVKAILE